MWNDHLACVSGRSRDFHLSRVQVINRRQQWNFGLESLVVLWHQNPQQQSTVIHFVHFKSWVNKLSSMRPCSGPVLSWVKLTTTTIQPLFKADKLQQVFRWHCIDVNKNWLSLKLKYMSFVIYFKKCHIQWQLSYTLYRDTCRQHRQRQTDLPKKAHSFKDDWN